MHANIQVYKKSKYAKLFLIICALFIAGALSGLIVGVIYKKELIPDLYHGTYFAFLLIGTINFWLVWHSQEKTRHLVEWNENVVRFMLPDMHDLQTVNAYNIKSIDFNFNKIKLELNNLEVINFNLNYFYSPERTKIISFFERLHNKNSGTIRQYSE